MFSFLISFFSSALPIFMAVLISAAISIWRVPEMTMTMLSLLLCASVAFTGGIVEDYTGRVSPARRLLLTMVGAVLAWWLVGARLHRIDLPYGVLSLPFVWLMLPLTVLAVAGIANAVNIIDVSMAWPAWSPFA